MAGGEEARGRSNKGMKLTKRGQLRSFAAYPRCSTDMKTFRPFSFSGHTDYTDRLNERWRSSRDLARGVGPPRHPPRSRRGRSGPDPLSDTLVPHAVVRRASIGRLGFNGELGPERTPAIRQACLRHY